MISVPAASSVVIKVGGAVARLEGAIGALPAMVRDPRCNTRFVLVHGGGNVISHWMQTCGLAVEFKDGLRVTDAAALDVAIMVLRGLVNTSLVAALSRLGVRALGLSGVDVGLIQSIPHPDAAMGFVGNAGTVDAALLHMLLGQGIVPVIAPIGLDPAGQIRNINADTVCGAIAGSLRSELVIFLTDVPGVMDATGSIVPRLTQREAIMLIAQGIIRGGMVPKVQASLSALASGALAVCIADGRDPDLLRGLVQGSANSGTVISADARAELQYAKEQQ